MVGDNDIVIIYNRQSGTDEKGHHVVLQFDMFRVEKGVIVEHWDADT